MAQKITSEQDLDTAIVEHTANADEQNRKQLKSKITYGAVTLLFIVAWSAFAYPQTKFEGLISVAVPVFLFGLFAVGAYEMIRDIRRYQAGQFKPEIIRLAKQGIVNAVIAATLFNVYMIYSIFSNSKEMFYMPRQIDGRVEFPSIFIALPLLIGINALMLYVIRTNQRKIKMETATINNDKSA